MAAGWPLDRQRVAAGSHNHSPVTCRSCSSADPTSHTCHRKVSRTGPRPRPPFRMACALIITIHCKRPHPESSSEHMHKAHVQHHGVGRVYCMRRLLTAGLSPLRFASPRRSIADMANKSRGQAQQLPAHYSSHIQVRGPKSHRLSLLSSGGQPLCTSILP